jgi:hypothetical protein
MCLPAIYQQKGASKMSSNVIFFGWDRPVRGSDQIAQELFGEFMQYLGGLQQAGTIQSFDPVFLDPHGGDLNGFCLIRGESDKLDGVVSSQEWEDLVTRADFHLGGIGVVRGVTGDLLTARFARFQKLASG